MIKAIDIILKPRMAIVKLVEQLTLDQLNEIPQGFNNNIIWNVGHLIATQQGICYKRSGLDIKVPESIFLGYKSDTKPEKFVAQPEINEICDLLISGIEVLSVDYEKTLFTNYMPWTTRYGVDLNNIDDAIGFLPFHEGLHLGTIMAMKRLLVK